MPFMTSQTLALAVLGRLASADEIASAAVEAAHLGANRHELAWALRGRCWVSLLAGDLPDALRAGEECAALLRKLEPTLLSAMAGWMVGSALVEAGEPARATALILELEGGEDLPHTHPPGRCIAYELLTRAALAAGQTDQASVWAARAQASASGLGDGLFAGASRRARAAVLLAQGHAPAAAQAALAAAAGAQRSGARIRPPAPAYSPAEPSPKPASATTRSPSSSAPRQSSQSAALDACATRPQASCARWEDASPAPPGTRLSGPALDELSSREREVAELVATGQANKQIAATLHVSVNTVQSHLKRIFAKLEVNNRAALAAVLADRRKDPRSP